MLRVERRKNPSGDTVVSVLYRGRPVFTWNDAEGEVSENMTWDRRIKEVFNAGVNAGRLMENPTCLKS